MAGPRRIAVLDIGKTNVKLSLIDLETLTETEVRTLPNTVLPAPPYPHFDTARIWEFLFDGLAALHAAHGIDAVTVTAHGAAGALLDAEGGLAAPILDYEHDGPDTLAAAYDAVRPDFAECGSPRLPLGLNLGAQIHWQLATLPGLRDRLETVVTYPQYWAHGLTGVAATERTSLGAHTDLWNPSEGSFSSLVDALGIRACMAPVRKASEAIGTLLPEIAARTGMTETTPVHCGIHDSNASLYPHLRRLAPPFTVVSTGTWVIAMAIGGAEVSPPPERDTLINVNALGDPVPSARFMGGREYEIALAGRGTACTDADVAGVLARRVMLLPSVEPTSGPFQGRASRWTVLEAGLSEGERYVAVSFYLALVTATCVSMIGGRGPVVVDGPFTENRPFLAMLAAAGGLAVTQATGAATGPRLGAALLVRPEAAGGSPAYSAAEPALAGDPSGYIAAWREAVEAPD